MRCLSKIAAAKGHSFSVLFVDVIGAFYSVLRLCVFPEILTDELSAQIMSFLNLPPEVMWDGRQLPTPSVLVH